jgi:hypothetical protein
MAADNDVLMYLIAKGSDPIAGESSSVLAPDDKLTSDFKPGRHFLVDHFAVGMALLDSLPCRVGGSLDRPHGG